MVYVQVPYNLDMRRRDIGGSSDGDGHTLVIGINSLLAHIKI